MKQALLRSKDKKDKFPNDFGTSLRNCSLIETLLKSEAYLPVFFLFLIAALIAWYHCENGVVSWRSPAMGRTRIDLLAILKKNLNRTKLCYIL